MSALKYAACLVFLFATVFCNSQSYQCVTPDAESYFKTKRHHTGINEPGDYVCHDTCLVAIKVDSVDFSGTDQVFYFNQMIRGEVGAYCKGPSWLGRKMVVKPNGDNLFFNTNEDTITIKSLAQFGETWKILTLADKSYIRGEVVDVSQQLVLDDTDTVKSIELMVFDSLDNPVADDINQRQIKISRSYGFVTTYQLYHFPTGPMWFTWSEKQLVGQTNPNRGIVNRGTAGIFDWNVGDEFHYHEENTVFVTQWFWDVWSSHKVIDKWFSTGSDSVFYKKALQVYRRDSNANNGYNSVSQYLDTIVNGFAIDGNQFFDTPPLQVHIGEASESASGYFEFQTKDTFKLKVDERNYYANFPEDTCFFPPIASLPYQSFADGIGFFESFRPTFEDWDELHRYLIYFKKPWGEWGTPIDFNTVSIPAEPHNVIQLSNSPNPFANQTAFNYNLGNVFGKNIKLVIMNILGAVVEEIPIAQESGRLTWNGQHQSTGTYLYELVVDGQSTIKGKMVMHGGK